MKEQVPGDLRMAGSLWPYLVASAVGLLPFTVFSTFLVPIADETGTSVAAVGGLRGIGGLAALVIGTALAPFVDRVPRGWAVAGSLVLLGASSALGAVGEFLTMTIFCALVGAAIAVLNPALTAAAADRFGSGAAAGRAATLVTATQSLAAVLAAPVIALPALLWGWQGNLLAVAAATLILAPAFLIGGVRGAHDSVTRSDRLGYLASFRALAAVPGVVPLLFVAALRTAAFMGYLAYLAAFYHERFGLSPGQVTLVWSLSGVSFFVGNLLAGRAGAGPGNRLGPETMLRLGLLVALVSMGALYWVSLLPPALVLTALLGASHATVAACVVSLLVRRCGALRGSALSLNAAGMSSGVFAGAALGGLGLGLAGYPGMALAFALLTLTALLISFRVRGASAA
ncbi:MFS transporter [Streptosporangium sp. KLBMP 9127]|nr:MFS transporter [Streptosporangium sp. KLBMP 9127]